MPNEKYTSVPLDEESDDGARRSPEGSSTAVDVRNIVFLVLFSVVWFMLGLAIGHKGSSSGQRTSAPPSEPTQNGLLSPQSFIPPIPTKEMMFEFPTKYEDTGIEGDKLWNDMMPLGSGFLRVPNPRQYDMPQSKAIDDDPENSEIYSLSITHQLHCLGVLRDVIRKYEKRDKSRFAGDGHEYHCLDYIRQAVLCAGDTTLDFAEATIGADGKEHRYGFSGANSKHQCRDWEAIKAFAVEYRTGNKTGIF